MRTTAQIIRDYQGPALFSFGFRPFFLLAGLWAACAVPLWLIAMLGGSSALAGAVTRDWHVHEMLFGYTGAVVVGYMIIAGANWTGRYPVAGRPIMALAGLWLAGRAAMLAADSLGPAAAVVEAAFLTLFALALWREQFAARKWRNLAPCVVVSLLAIADWAFHSRSALPALGPASERFALGLIVFLMALMGGRLVPSFTRNWMAQRKMKPEPAPHDRLDIAATGVTAAAFFSWLILPEASVSGVLLILAGAVSFARLLRWRGWAALPEPMVWVLHLAYFWIASGMAILGSSILLPTYVPVSAAVHALSVGGIGVMTLAMMTRTARSHTRRERSADLPTTAIYVLVNLAAATRVAAAFATDQPLWWMISATSWAAAFGLFVVRYGPMLIAPSREYG